MDTEGHNKAETTSSVVSTDVILTPTNKLKALKRINHLFKKRAAIKIGMTLKNEYLFLEVIKDLEAFNIMLKEDSRMKYKAGIHDAVCITVIKIGKHK